MKPITVWSVYVEARYFKFNHIEDGHVPWEQRTPTSMCAAQEKAWSKGWWTRHYAYLDASNRVVTAVTNFTEQ